MNLIIKNFNFGLESFKFIENVTTRKSFKIYISFIVFTISFNQELLPINCIPLWKVFPEILMTVKINNA